MTISDAKLAAHQQMNAAIASMVEAYGVFDDGQMTVGWIVIVAGTRFLDPDLDPDYFVAEDGDEEESVSSVRGFVKRGQLPHSTRGILECYADRWRE